MKKIEIEITGISPLLMHRFSEEAEAQVAKGTSHAITRPNPEEAAERAAYRLNGPSSNLYLPSVALVQAIRGASGLHKIGRRSAKSIVAAAIRISPERIDLGVSQYQTDKRSAVNRNTGNRVMVYRPRLDSWRARFNIEYEDDLIQDEAFLRRIVEDAGKRVGILSYRPAKNGDFGRFAITAWKAVK